jgi:uncharacterized cofD-like protein
VSSWVRKGRPADDPAGPGDGSRAVAIGGGHGTSRSLQALPRIVDHVTAVVTVADDGGSSGRLRRDLDVLPPGDLRMAATALAGDRALADLIGYRFRRGELAGHALGNLILVALQELSGGDLVVALDRLCSVIDAPGRVLPCTTVPLTLVATTPLSEVRGQTAVAATPRLGRLRLEPSDPPATPDAVRAIERADLIVLGPGSLYTSLLPNLLVPGITQALARRRGPLVLVANLREQPGETEGLTLADHLAVIADHVPELTVDVLVAHAGPAPSGPGQPLVVDDAALRGRVGRVRTADLLDGEDGHAPTALAHVLDAVLRG